MKTKEIKDVPTSTLENNKLIAGFMGAKDRFMLGNTLTSNRMADGEIWLPMHGICNANIIDNGKALKYHSSWDWLMPVVEKIESLDNNEGDFDCHFEISKGFTSVIAWHGEQLITSHYTSKIEATYKAVIEFIKFYNEG